MKRHPIPLASLLAVLALSTSAPGALKAQTTNTPASASGKPPSAQAQKGYRHGSGDESHGWSSLTPQEAYRLRADLKKIHEDPKLEGACKTLRNDMNALRQTKRELLVKADPSIKPVLDKMAHEERCARVSSWFNRVFHLGKPYQNDWQKGYGAWAKLSDAEREHLKNDMQLIRKDPKLIAAQKTVYMDIKAVRQIERERLIRIDPSIKPVFDKLEKANKGGWHDGMKWGG